MPGGGGVAFLCLLVLARWAWMCDSIVSAYGSGALMLRVERAVRALDGRWTPLALVWRGGCASLARSPVPMLLAQLAPRGARAVAHLGGLTLVVASTGAVRGAVGCSAAVAQVVVHGGAGASAAFTAPGLLVLDHREAPSAEPAQQSTARRFQVIATLAACGRR